MTEVRFRYETPSAFRNTLKDRFGQIARANRRYSLDELQRQFGYDRALARLFSSDDADRWVLKGAEALLARLATARHSKDVDVFYNAADADVDDAVDALQTALRIDLGDHFGFDITRFRVCNFTDPVAGGVPDADQHRHVPAARLGERLPRPRPPVDRIVGVLEQVRRSGIGEAIRSSTISPRKPVGSAGPTSIRCGDPLRRPGATERNRIS
jgi:hypothetical protein